MKTEVELAEKFINYFGENADVYCEVPLHGRICDFVVKREHISIAVECKMSFNMDVIEQALLILGYANYVYVAIPTSKKKWFAEKICKDYGIGILYYDKNLQFVREHVKARLYRRIVKPELKDYMKKNVAGSQSLRVTAFGNFINELYSFLSRNNGATYKQCFDSVDKYYRAEKNFKSNIYQYVRRGIIKHINIENGKLFLDQAGYDQYLKEQDELFRKMRSR